VPNVVVSQHTAPTQAFVLQDERGNPVDLTGKTVKLVVKRDIEDPDSLILFDLAATPDADQVNNTGLYTLAFDFNKTSFPANIYPAALRVWPSATTSNPPERVEASSYTVERAVKAVET
jgi:hypothetical protein